MYAVKSGKLVVFQLKSSWRNTVSSLKSVFSFVCFSPPPRTKNASRLFVKRRAVWCLEVQHSRRSKAQLHLPQLQPWPDPTSGGWMGSLCELLRPRAQIPHALCRTRCVNAIRVAQLSPWTRTDLVSLIGICVILIVMSSSGKADP